MNMKPEPSASPQPQLAELIVSLEGATHMAKQLQTTTDQNHLLQIYTALHQAHHSLSSFISPTSFPSIPPETEPMMVGDEGEEENSKDGGIDAVEERMRECFIQNKRTKRPLSPSLVVEERRVADDMGFDPHGNRLRALDLIYQFHG